MRKTELITALTPGAPPMTAVVGAAKNMMHLIELSLPKLIYTSIVPQYWVT